MRKNVVAENGTIAGVHEIIVRRRTGYRPDFLSIFASDEEDDVSLAGVDIVILEEEELVHAVLLKRTEADEEADSASK
jgi:hypothetical protein